MADLDDRQMSKRLHEIAAFDTDMKELPTDFCPKQDTASKDSKSCADCKDFKTHRVYNALMVKINNNDGVTSTYINNSFVLSYWDFLYSQRRKNSFIQSKNYHNHLPQI